MTTSMKRVVRPRTVVQVPSWLAYAINSMYVLAVLKAVAGVIVLMVSTAPTLTATDRQAFLVLGLLTLVWAVALGVLTLLLKRRNPAARLLSVLAVLPGVLGFPLATIPAVVALIGLHHPSTMSFLYPKKYGPPPKETPGPILDENAALAALTSADTTNDDGESQAGRHRPRVAVPPVVRPSKLEELTTYVTQHPVPPRPQERGWGDQAPLASVLAPALAMFLNVSATGLDPQSRALVAFFGLALYGLGLGVGIFALQERRRRKITEGRVLAIVGIVINALLLGSVALGLAVMLVIHR